jgi:hypothetical protein
MQIDIRKITALGAIGFSLACWQLPIATRAIAQDQDVATAETTAAASAPIHKHTGLSFQFYEKALWIFKHAAETHYAHERKDASAQVVINGGESCSANTDCSGFISYLLLEMAPKHYENVVALQPNKEYPQAAAYAQFFQSLGTDAPQGGWLGLKSYKDLRRGDIIAWQKPPSPEQPGKKKGNSGHVMIATGPAGEPEETRVDGKRVRFVPVTVLDSSSVDHFKPEFLPPHITQSHRDGLGIGVVRLIINNDDKVIGYWEGTYSNENQIALRHPSYSDVVGFARLEHILRTNSP